MDPLNVLILEDSPADATLVVRELGEMDRPVVTKVVMTGEDLRAALGSQSWDIVVSDYSMPGFGAMEALEITRELSPELPFVVMSGTIGEERAVELLRSGVTDYFMKEHMGRVCSVVERAVREARDHAMLTEAQARLLRAGQEWLDTFNALSDGVLMLDEDGVVRRLNKAAARHLGLPASSIEGGVAPELLASRCPAAAEWLEAWGACRPDRFEIGPCAPDGRWFACSCDPVDGNGHPATGHVLVLSDITERKRSEEELRAVLGRLKKTMGGTVTLAVRMVESRDPYTAGHQERVAELAVEIARRLGSGTEHLELIRTAALLHDVGKIAVPAEILVRPGKLQELEWSLIKRHPEVGAKILEEAEFEGDIAEIVLQHHERLDGTGYPRGLKGAAICREAQIVTVADVTEAMTAHRPYRPACTSEQLIEELAGGRGTRYAEDVVDACLAYLESNGFLCER